MLLKHSLKASSSSSLKKIVHWGETSSTSCFILTEAAGVKGIHNRSFHSTTSMNASSTSDANVPIYVHIKESNIPPSVHSKIGRNLHRKESHPLCIIKTAIQNHFIKQAENSSGRLLDDMM